MTIQNTEASVKIENVTSKPFSISQSQTLDLVIKKLNLTGDSLELKQIVVYADDVALLAGSLKALREVFHKLQNKATLVGLNIKEDKTLYTKIKRTGTEDITHLNIANFAFENVKSLII